MKPKRTTHNYTSELQLKSLLIRIQNKTLQGADNSAVMNRKINKYISWFTKINNKKYDQEQIQRKNVIKYRIRDKVIELSEKTKIDELSYETFGSIILLMISKILTKPNFSGYTYKDEMYSDAIHKILKYLHNFNHKMISERSGTIVNSFAYISQIIHNSVIYIINIKKKEQLNINNQVSLEIINHNLSIEDYNKQKSSNYHSDERAESELVVHDLYIDCEDLIQEIKDLDIEDYQEGEKIVIHIPKTYNISMDMYNELRPLLKNTSIVRMKDEPEENKEEEC